MDQTALHVNEFDFSTVAVVVLLRYCPKIWDMLPAVMRKCNNDITAAG